MCKATEMNWTKLKCNMSVQCWSVDFSCIAWTALSKQTDNSVRFAKSTDQVQFSSYLLLCTRHVKSFRRAACRHRWQGLQSVRRDAHKGQKYRASRQESAVRWAMARDDMSQSVQTTRHQDGRQPMSVGRLSDEPMMMMTMNWYSQTSRQLPTCAVLAPSQTFGPSLLAFYAKNKSGFKKRTKRFCIYN